MTDVAAAPVATEAPVAPSSAETPSPEGQGYPQGDNRRSRIEELVARHEQSRAAREQPRSEDGQFAAPGGEEAAPSAAPTSEEAAPVAGGDTETPQAAPGPPEGFVRVPYPEGHPMRAQGVDYEDVPAAAEQRIRALMNAQDPARRSELERLRRSSQEAAQRALAAEAQLAFYRDHGNELWSPEDQEKYDSILSTWGEADAERFKRGRMQENQERLNQVTEQAMVSDIDQNYERAATTFRTEAFTYLPQYLPGITQEDINEALEMYGSRVNRLQAQLLEQGYAPAQIAEALQPSRQMFFEVAGNFLKTRPGVIEALRSRQAAEDAERQRIAAEERERQQAELREAAGRHARNPQRRLGGATSTSQPVPGNEDSNVGKSVADIRAASKSRLRALGERIGQRGG